MDKLKHIVKHLDDKKANNIVVLDVSEITPLAQYFIICDASNSTQLRSMADSLEKSLITSGYGFHHKEGKKESGWILVDAQDIIVHIFLPNDREKYSLEKLYINQRKLQTKRLLK
jgi:ribosome-associated protein